MAFEAFVIIEIAETSAHRTDRRQLVRNLFGHALEQPVGIRPIFLKRLVVIETDTFRFALRDTSMLDGVAERLRRIQMIRSDTQTDMLPVHLVSATEQPLVHSLTDPIEREVAAIQHTLDERELVRIEQHPRFKNIEVSRQLPQHSRRE